MGAFCSGEDCIECEGHWLAPPAFEDSGGKGSSKKWKTSIFYENKSLQLWFEVRLFGSFMQNVRSQKKHSTN